MKLYHVSHTPNLKILEPKISSHGKPYVYATTNLELALFFGSKKSHGDLDGIYGTTDIENGNVLSKPTPFFYESFPNSFKERFEGESCSIYEVDPSTFKKGQTSFASEVVSEEPVKILKETKIEDLYVYLKQLIKDKKIIFHKFSNDKEYQEKLLQHIKDRLQRMNILAIKNTGIYNFCKEKFPDILAVMEQKERV